VKLDDLVRDAKKDTPDVDWKSVDEKLFARLEQEPRPLRASEDDELRSGGRVAWIGAAFTLAAAAAALVFVHPAHENVDAREAASLAAPLAGPTGPLVRGQRIDVTEDVSYFESPGKVRWSAPRGSVLRVEQSSPLVLSLEQGAAEAQVTPVPSGEAFAIDVTASTGAVVRVAVHGTHLRVARAGDQVTVDLTEGVVSIGAPPRRGSTIGTLVTAPAHVELDATSLDSIRVDHAPSAVRPAERVTPAPRDPEVALLPQSPVQHEVIEPLAHETHALSTPVRAPKSHSDVAVVDPPAPTWLTTTDELASAIAAECGKSAASTYATTLALHVDPDGTVKRAIFTPPMFPEGQARDCSAIVIYKRTKLAAGDYTVPISITPR